jgi:hypothetical protein
MFDPTPRIAQQCAMICDRNGDFKSAEEIRTQFFLVKPPCALLAPKVNYDSNHNRSD